MKLSLAFSPCPNDTFIFDAMVNGMIDTGDYRFEVRLADVQELNEMAFKGVNDCTKISYGAYPLMAAQYTVLNAGSALGQGVGPLLIASRPGMDIRDESVAVAIPGEHTTAHLLFNMVYPGKSNKVFMRYDKVEDFVLQGRGAGVIIHENRFTYAARGLHRLADLGTLWEDRMKIAIPLGGIVVRRSLGEKVAADLSGMIRESLQYAWDQYPGLSAFIKNNAQEMSEDVMRQHINLYVNEYSADLGPEGRSAIEQLMHYSGMEPVQGMFAG